MNIVQQYQFWVGLGLVLLVVVFLMVAFFKAPNMTRTQYTILKLLSALCAGCAGSLIAGEALFRFEGAIGAQNKYLFSGTAGFALFRSSREASLRYWRTRRSKPNIHYGLPAVFVEDQRGIGDQETWDMLNEAFADFHRLDPIVRPRAKPDEMVEWKERLVEEKEQVFREIERNDESRA